MGYGTRALQLLQKYYEGEMVNLNENGVEDVCTEIPVIQDEQVDLLQENIEPRRNMPPLLLELGEWLQSFFTDFRRRVSCLLGYELRDLSPTVALSIMHNKLTKTGTNSPLTAEQLNVLMTPYDIKRLELYS